jgi:Fur family iron response transcriptional regulator
VLVEPGKIYFDTNTESHHHFYIEETGELVDVPDDECKIVSLPLIPAEYTVNQVEITIRLEKTKEADPRSRN